MNLRFKINALASVALALMFYWFFMFTKHDPPLAAILPFGDDPYDAIGSFCMIVSFLLAALSLVRAFRPRGTIAPSELSRVFLARTQIAAALGVLVTLAADGIAMMRHTSQWIGKTHAGELLALMAGMATVSLAYLLLIRKSAQGLLSKATQHEWGRALFTVLVSAIVLAVFPEALIRSVFFHFLTILVGFVVIAAPQAALAVALVSCNIAGTGMDGIAHPSRSGRWIQWSVTALIGIAIGAFALAGEIFADGVIKAPLARVLLVSAVYIGAGMAAMLISFAFLGKPLGLSRGDWLD